LATAGCSERAAAPPSDGSAGEELDQGRTHDGPPRPKKLPWVSNYAGKGCLPTTTWPDGPRQQTVIGPDELAPGPDDRLYFADSFAGLRVVDGDQIRTVFKDVGGGGFIVASDGQIINAGFWYIQEIKGGKATLIAGSRTEGGISVDGPALAARFNKIEDIALDAQGRLLIADKYRVRMLDNGQVTTLAGSDFGSAYPPDGPVATATFLRLWAVVDSPAGILVADETTLRQIYNGQVTTLAGVFGKPWTIVDGPLDKARFSRLRSLAWKKDVLYMVDWDHARRIRYIKDKVVHSLTDGQRGFKDGYISEALFDTPMYLVVDRKGNLLVSDVGNCRIRHIQLEP